MRNSFGKRLFRVRSLLLFLTCGLLVLGYYKSDSIQEHLIRGSRFCAAPFVQVYVWISSYIESHRTKKECYAKIQQDMLSYKDHYERLLADYIALHHVRDENQKVLLDREFLARYDTSYTVRAQVIQRIKTSREQALIIDAGAKRGVSDSMCAVYKNCLIGKVIAVSPYHSKIMLITDPRSCIAAFALESGAQGILRGMGNDACSLDFVSHLQKIEQNMSLVASGEGCVYPRGFGLARVDTVTKTDDDLYYHITSSPLIDPHGIEYCYIVQKGSEYKDDRLVASDKALIDEQLKLLAKAEEEARKREEKKAEIKRAIVEAKPVEQPTPPAPLVPLAPATLDQNSAGEQKKITEKPLTSPEPLLEPQARVAGMQ